MSDLPVGVDGGLAAERTVLAGERTLASSVAAILLLLRPTEDGLPVRTAVVGLVAAFVVLGLPLLFARRSPRQRLAAACWSAALCGAVASVSLVLA